MDYMQLKQMLSQHEREHPEAHLTACITFASFGPNAKKDYPWRSRTYVISSDNKAFQPDKGGYSIYGRCLDGTDPFLRLDVLMKEEHGGKDSWIVEDCGIVGYLLIECSDCNISAPKLFYTHHGALDYMLSRLAETGELDAGQLKARFTTTKEVYEEEHYRASQDSAWLTDSSEDWHWKLQRVCIYGPMKIVIPETEDTSCPM